MPLYIYHFISVKLLQGIFAILLVSAVACSSDSSPTGSEINGDDPAGTESFDLLLNSSSALIAATERDLYKLSALDGSTELVFEGGDGSWEFLSPADVVNDVAYIASTDNILNAIDLNTGELLWEFELGIPDDDGNPTAPSCSASSCYIVGGGYDLYEIGIPDGEPRGSVSLDRNGGAIQAIGSRLPLITEQKIFIGVDYDDGSYRLNVYSRNDGSLLESIEFDDQVSATPVASNGKLLVAASRSLHALDFSTHETIWSTESSGVSNPVVIGQMIIAGIHDPQNQYVDTDFGTAAINISTGEVLWVNRMPITTRGIAPTSDGSLVITAMPVGSELAFSNPTNPRALRPANGSVVWDLGTSGVTRDIPLAVPGHLFYRSLSFSIGSEFDSGVAALNSRTGQTNWTATQGFAENVSKIFAPMVLVHEGQVYRSEAFPTISK